MKFFYGKIWLIYGYLTTVNSFKFFLILNTWLRDINKNLDPLFGFSQKTFLEELQNATETIRNEIKKFQKGIFFCLKVFMYIKYITINWNSDNFVCVKKKLYFKHNV